MENNYSIYNLLYNSYLTLFGFTSKDESDVYKFFDTICYRNPEKAVRLYTTSTALIQNVSENETYVVGTIKEIYEIIPKLRNKIIIIDNISDLLSTKVASNDIMIKSNMLRQIGRNIRDYCDEYDCSFIVGDFTYKSNGTLHSFIGGDSLIYNSDNVFIVSDGILNCRKSRYSNQSVFKNVNIKSFYIREENLKKLLEE